MSGLGLFRDFFIQSDQSGVVSERCFEGKKPHNLVEKRSILNEGGFRAESSVLNFNNSQFFIVIIYF